MKPMAPCRCHAHALLAADMRGSPARSHWCTPWVSSGVIRRYGQHLSRIVKTRGLARRGVSRRKAVQTVGMTSPPSRPTKTHLVAPLICMPPPATGQGMDLPAARRRLARPRILPRGYVAMMASPVAASGGEYGHGLVWLWGSDAITPARTRTPPLEYPWTPSGWRVMTAKHAIIPSRQLSSCA